MRAAEAVENPERHTVVPLEGTNEKRPAAPVYAPRDDSESTGIFDVEVDVRGWSAQLAQWLIIFAAIGVVIGGAKWWSARERVTTTRSVAAPSTMSEPSRRPGEPATPPIPSRAAPGPSVRAGEATGGDSIPAPSVAAADTGNAAAPARLAVAEGLEPAPIARSAAAPVNVPTLRAPADVPYPQRIHDVAPELAATAPVSRGIAVLSLLIGPKGNVTEVELLRGLGPPLDEAAISAAWQWKFAPTVHEGRPVAVRSNFTVRFGY